MVTENFEVLELEFEEIRGEKVENNTTNWYFI